MFRDIAQIDGATVLQRVAGLRLRSSKRDTSPATPSDDVRTFVETDEGSGAFGHWTLDADGLPAYCYTLNQAASLHAQYPTTDGYLRRNHWHQIGNDHITAMTSNEGVIQVYLADRGGVILNRLDARDGLAEAPGLVAWLARALRRLLSPALTWWVRHRIEGMLSGGVATGLPHGASAVKMGGAGHVADVQAHARATATARRTDTARAPAYGGGFSYLSDGERAWSSAHAWRPAKAETRRTFGIGYAETEMTHRGVRQVRRVYAPAGNDPVLLMDVRLDNLKQTPVDLYYVEYWDVNPHQLRMQWLRTWVGAAGDDARRALNAHFRARLIPEGDDARRALRVRFQPPNDAPDKAQANEIDWWPADTFLADLSASGAPDGQFINRAAFFGRGGVRQPDAITPTARPANANSNGDSMPSCLALRRRLHLEPGASATLRFAFGVAQPGQSLDFIDRFRVNNADADHDPVTRTRDHWRASLCYFTTGASADGDPVLQREMAWHAYSLLSSTVYNAFWNAHVVPQGSAYLYLHGVDGVPRDQALFSVPLTYLRPDLARETLRLIMSVTRADTGGIIYAYAGHGILSDGLIHTNPSDIDLFFLWALSEYIAATGDAAFLDCTVPFYPRDAPAPFGLGNTVLDHARAAFRHLRDVVGAGDHGLIKIGSGDWSDGVVVENAVKDGLGGVDYQNSKAHGESVPNTQMALWVLPLAADVLEPHDPALAAEMRAPLADWRKAVEDSWIEDKHFYLRAILRDDDNRDRPIFDDRIHLESQVWALISGAAESGHEAALIESIKTHLDDPSPIGATQIEQGMVWPAISQLLTWGYARGRPDLAWRSLHRNTFAAHAIAFPNVWFNIWTGPDGVNGKHAANPGGTWASPVTPMCDYPAQNCNPHAMALLGLLRVCGIEPAGDGLRIAPQAPPERFTLDLPLLRLEVAPGRIAGEYRPAATTRRTLHVRLSQGARDVAARVGGQTMDVRLDGDNEVLLRLDCQEGQPVAFEVTFLSDVGAPLSK